MSKSVKNIFRHFSTFSREGANREKLTVKKLVDTEMFFFHRLCPVKPWKIGVKPWKIRHQTVKKSAPKIHHFFTVSFSPFTSSWFSRRAKNVKKSSKVFFDTSRQFSRGTNFPAPFGGLWIFKVLGGRFGYFLFFLLGEGEGGAHEAPGGGATGFSLKITEGGRGSRKGRGRVARRVSAANWGIFGGVGGNYFFGAETATKSQWNAKCHSNKHLSRLKEILEAKNSA